MLNVKGPKGVNNVQNGLMFLLLISSFKARVCLSVNTWKRFCYISVLGFVNNFVYAIISVV